MSDGVGLGERSESDEEAPSEDEWCEAPIFCSSSRSESSYSPPSSSDEPLLSLDPEAFRDDPASARLEDPDAGAGALDRPFSDFDWPDFGASGLSASFLISEITPSR